MDELIAPQRNADMRRSRADGLEEQQVAWLHLAARNSGSQLILVAHLARQPLSVLGEDILHEATAVEA